MRILLKKALHVPYSYTAVGHVFQGDSGLIASALSAEVIHARNPWGFKDEWTNLAGTDMRFSWTDTALTTSDFGFLVKLDNAEVLMTSEEMVQRLLRGLHILECFREERMHEIAALEAYGPQYATPEVTAFYEKRQVGIIWFPQ